MIHAILSSLCLFAAVIVGTWNGQWFPSGRAEHRAHPDVEAATIRAAGRMIRAGLDRLDPSSTNDVIICLNEIRGPRVARALAGEIGRTNLNLAIISGYRRRDRFDQQQDAILTTLPVASTNWAYWARSGKLAAPRGYARASLVVSPAVTAEVYAVHLKSNYGGNTAAKRKTNADKRKLAGDQLLKLVGASKSCAIVAGDFNCDAWDRRCEREPIFGQLADAGFANVLALLAPDRRGTHPSRTWGDSALDYIFTRGLESAGLPILGDATGLSDHQPVFTAVEIAK